MTRPQHFFRVVLYGLWSATAVYIGSAHFDVGEVCTILLIVCGLLLGESLAANARQPTRMVAFAAIVIVCTICLRCTAAVMSWDTAALPSESTHQLVQRHFSEFRRR